MNNRTEERRIGEPDRRRATPEDFLARVKLTVAELEPRTNYRAPVAQLTYAAQVAARNDFPLQVVTAGSMYATFALSAEELAAMMKESVSLTLDK